MMDILKKLLLAFQHMIQTLSPTYLQNPIILILGIYVVDISSGSPAASSDLKKGAIINSIDEIEVSTMNDLKEYIYTKKPNDTVTLNISRGKISKEISVILGKK